MDIVVLIPAYNEENAVGKVIRDIPKDIVNEIIVVNNNSLDKTRWVAEEAGAIVLDEPIQGYGKACLRGLKYLKEERAAKPDIVVFIDADYSDHPEEMKKIVEPILQTKVDMVIGSRALGKRESGSMTIPQVFGNWLATSLLKGIYGAKYSDLGPFRAITWQALEKINMQDEDFGWTVEMQLKVAQHGLGYCEVPVSYRKRIGKSKISGTIKGVVMAGYKIIYTIFKYR